ncbi:hypothetical protein [Ruminococcus sp.]|uniref:hypothetical protein n=1 Tax=Ruminococcus sp. TaxID=41978 RepID=UPI001B749E58|nr:hypothetical protein [Ruminococcus sp.]MBP5433240.1 hypothetical protein [Ruminococcus sp.]
MSSFKNFASMLNDLQQQADGRGTLDGSAIEDFLSIAGYEQEVGGGDSGMLSEIFPICAKVTLVVSGMTEGLSTKFTDVGTSTGVLLVRDTEYGWMFSEDEVMVTNGTFEYYLLSTSESGELDYTNYWDVSVSGGAELGDDGENKWVDVTGDCTITITKR